MRAWLTLSFGLVCAPLAFAQPAWTVEPLDIRPAGDDFAPVLLDSYLVITSIRERPQVLSYTNADNGRPLADLYKVRLNAGKPGRPVLMDGGVNSPWNDGPASFSPGGDTICITRNIATRGRKWQGQQLGLFFSVRQKGGWSEAIPFEHNSDEWSVMHGSFSTDGQTLYFSSNMPGSHGGSDLYMCRREGQGWSAPTNLGTTINSEANELFPNMSALGELHFASNRTGGPGGLDLYTSVWTGTDFTAPIALPEPINSAANDYGWTAHADGISGYFSSDRGGTGQIFRFTRRAVPFQDCVEQQPTELCYRFEDEGSFETDNLPLRYEWDFGDGHRERGLNTEHCYATPGLYTVKLNIVDTLSKNVFFNETTYDLEVLADVQAVIRLSGPLVTGVPISFDAAASNLPGFTIREVHWDLGDGTIRSGDRVDHTYTSTGGLQIRMDLIGNPDGRGGFEHHCVYRDLEVSSEPVPLPTVSASRVAAQPRSDDFAFRYVELPNDYVSAAAQELNDVFYSVQILASPDRMDLNDARFIPIRRKYSITERFQPKQRLYTYSIGSGTTPALLYEAYSFALGSGFGSSVVELTPKDRPLSIEKAEELSLSELDNTVISISRILFETGKSTFSPAFIEALDRVLQVIEKYPQLELVIEAHTDNVGRAERNMALSDERAQSVMAYFITEGVDAKRLRPIGYGAANPVATNGTEAGRALNRRVDFRLNVPDTESMAHP